MNRQSSSHANGGHGGFQRFLHLFAGGVGATVGQCVTCPLDVVQTRLMSTHLNFSNLSSMDTVLGGSSSGMLQVQRPMFGVGYFQVLYLYLKHMIRTEGLQSLYKGLSPSLLGIAPAKSIYFFCYANTKNHLNQKISFREHEHLVHISSAVLAGSITGTVTNPIWYVKTKLQLKNSGSRTSVLEVVRTGYQKHGVKCFFRGLTASYVGVFETVIFFLLYEDLKKTLNQRQNLNGQFSAVNLTVAALASKICATVTMYPHEVVRTRLRQDIKDAGGRLKYRNFLQTLITVAREEKRAGLYGGLGTSLIRQLPNTAVMFLTYEAILHFLEKDWQR